MTDDQEPIAVSNYEDLPKYLKRVENKVFWKSAGLPEFEEAMALHSNHTTPDKDLDAGLAYMVNPEVLSVRVSIVVSTDDIYVRADTATEYHWNTSLALDDETVSAFLRKEGIRRALATTSAHVVDAGSTVGFNLENPSLRLEKRMKQMVEEHMRKRAEDQDEGADADDE